MNRRTALLSLLAIFGRGMVGDAREANVTIDLNLIHAWKVKLDGKEVFITGPELFKALGGVGVHTTSTEASVGSKAS